MKLGEYNTKDLYLSDVQRKLWLADPNSACIVTGRGTGKTTKMIAPLMMKRVYDMQGACFAIVGQTYTQVQQRTLASAVGGWKDLGFKEDVHWKVGKPKKGWGEPLFTPIKWDNVISTITGTCFVACSLDRPGMINGYTFWGIFGDEAKTFDYEIFREDLLPTLRAPEYHFPKSAYNRTLILTTSMPALPEGQWILDFEKQQNKKLINKIIEYAELYESIKLALLTSKNKYTKQKLEKELIRIGTILEILRRKAFLYVEASTLSNLDILGPEYIKQQQKLLGNKFDTEILNIRPKGVETMFYNGLCRKHFYNAFDYEGYIDTFGLFYDERSNNCRRDKDHDRTLPLIIGVDFGVKFNCIVVCQRDYNKNEVRVLKNFYVEKGGTILDVVDKVAEYYSARDYKRIEAYYDNAGNNRQTTEKRTPAEMMRDRFSEKGWSVELMTKGGANKSHHAKYYAWQSALTFNNDFPIFKINEGNAEETILSMQYARAIKNPKGFIQKDKSSERSKVILQKFATHLSDALDTVIVPIYEKQGLFI